MNGKQITYRLSTHTIAGLSDALELCAALQLGVMLDIKASAPSIEFLKSISKSLKGNGLESCALTLSTSRIVKQELKELVIFPLSKEDLGRILNYEAADLHGRYYFDWGSRIEAERVRLVQDTGAFVLAAINFFPYPRHARATVSGLR